MTDANLHVLRARLLELIARRRVEHDIAAHLGDALLISFALGTLLTLLALMVL